MLLSPGSKIQSAMEDTSDADPTQGEFVAGGLYETGWH